jgi:hypothetical protein
MCSGSGSSFMTDGDSTVVAASQRSGGSSIPSHLRPPAHSDISPCTQQQVEEALKTLSIWKPTPDDTLVAQVWIHWIDSVSHLHTIPLFPRLTKTPAAESTDCERARLVLYPSDPPSPDIMPLCSKTATLVPSGPKRSSAAEPGTVLRVSSLRCLSSCKTWQACCVKSDTHHWRGS